MRIDSPMSDFSENFGLWQLFHGAVDDVQAILEGTEHNQKQEAVEKMTG